MRAACCRLFPRLSNNTTSSRARPFLVSPADLPPFPVRSASLYLAGRWPPDELFRTPFRPVLGEGAFHAGIDISVPTGTPVQATADGTVMSAEWAGQYGRMVVIDHGDGVQTYYAHMSHAWM